MRKHSQFWFRLLLFVKVSKLTFYIFFIDNSGMSQHVRLQRLLLLQVGSLIFGRQLYHRRHWIKTSTVWSHVEKKTSMKELKGYDSVNILHSRFTNIKLNNRLCMSTFSHDVSLLWKHRLSEANVGGAPYCETQELPVFAAHNIYALSMQIEIFSKSYKQCSIML